MDIDQYDRPKAGASFMETALSILFAALLAIIAALAAALLMYRWDEAADAQITAYHVAEATARKELPPEEYAYWRRHERNSRLCRGQDYVEMCCTDGRPDLTCLTHEDIR